MAHSNLQIPPEQTDLEQPVTSFLIFLLLVIQFLWFVKGPIPLTEGALVGSDGYMHLSRVLHLVESGEWFSAVYPRSNAPYGEVQHWTRLMDLVLLSGAGLAALFVPFKTGLHWWGVLLGPVLHILAVVALVWMVRPMFNRDQQLLVGGVFLFQPALIQCFLAGRPDHHSLLMLCFILLLGLTHRIVILPWEPKRCVTAAALVATAMWASVESLMILSVSLAILAIGWVWFGGDWGKRNLALTGAVSGFTFLALLVDRGFGQIAQTDYDRFSLVHWSIITLIASFWIVVWLQDKKGRYELTPLQRLGFGVAGIGVVLCLQWVFFPKFFYGPLVNVDQEIMSLLWNRVAETQPIIPTDSWEFGRFVLYLGTALPAVPYLIWLIWKEPDLNHRFFWSMIGFGVLLFFPLAFREIRWVAYAELLILLPYTHLMGRILRRVSDPLTAPWNAMVKISLVLVSTVWCLLVGVKMLEANEGAIPKAASQECSIGPLSEYLNDPNGWGRRNQTILAFVDFGPELLYRTRHQVIMTPYHRNTDGNLDGYRIMSDPDGTTAQALLRARMVDLILMCPSSATESSFFQNPHGKESLYDRLHHGPIPPWIGEISLPTPLAEHFKLFQIRRIS